MIASRSQAANTVYHPGPQFEGITWDQLQVSRFRPTATEGAIDATVQIMGSLLLDCIQVVEWSRNGCDYRRTWAVIAFASLEKLDTAGLCRPFPHC